MSSHNSSANASCTVLAIVSGESITNVEFSMSYRKQFCCCDVPRSITLLLKNSNVDGDGWLPLTFLCSDMYK